MPLAFLPLQHNTRSNAHGISSFEYKSFYTLLSWGHAPVFLGNEIDLTYSALKVQQNTGRGEVKRNPCLELANR